MTTCKRYLHPVPHAECVKVDLAGALRARRRAKLVVSLGLAREATVRMV